MATEDLEKGNLPGVGDEAVVFMARLEQSMGVLPGAVVQKVSIEVVRGRNDWSSGVCYGTPLGMVPERPTHRLTIEWEESGG